MACDGNWLVNEAHLPLLLSAMIGMFDLMKSSISSMREINWFIYSTDCEIASRIKSHAGAFCPGA